VQNNGLHNQSGRIQDGGGATISEWNAEREMAAIAYTVKEGDNYGQQGIKKSNVKINLGKW
jgi:hypothetical protein